MQARLGTTLALLWMSFVALATIVQQPETGAAAVVVEGKPFTHIQHVPRAWIDTLEVWRDCRGCHRFDAKNDVSAPQQECDKCHKGPGLLERQFDAGWKDDLRRHRTRTREAFRHHTHAMLECRQCHEAKDLAERKQPRPEEDFLFDDFFVRTGPGQCAECHEPGRARLAAFRFFAAAEDDELARRMGLPGKFVPPTPTTFAAYADQLVAAFAGATGGMNTTKLSFGGGFTHDDHPGIGCVECHVDVQGAGAPSVGGGATTATLVQCGMCHIAGEQKTPLPVATGPERAPRPLASLGTFAHADHHRATKKPGVCSEAAYTKIAEQECRACHKQVPVAVGVPGPDFPFAAGKSKHRYVDCIACHDVASWQTGESEAAPRHASTSAEGKGGWDTCKDCHVFGQQNMATDRPLVEVARRRERTFEFAANVHPHITAEGILRSGQTGRATVQSCTDCHRSKVPQLTTRLVKKVFRHATHLPAEPTQANCESCHPNALTAPKSEQLASDGRTYSLASCGDCHWGGDVKELAVPVESQKTMCVEFPHGPHGTAAKLSCLECHARDENGQDIVTLPEALLCNKCHDHKEGGSKREELFGEAVGSCARCHHPESAPLVASVPAIRGSPEAASDGRYKAMQNGFAGFAEAQFHPLGGKCIDCHRANLDKAAAVPALEPIQSDIADHLRATRAASVHEQENPKGTKSTGCLGCHWKPLGGSWDASVRSANVDPKGWNDFRSKPGSAATRKAFGNQREGYPGNEGMPR